MTKVRLRVIKGWHHQEEPLGSENFVAYWARGLSGGSATDNDVFLHNDDLSVIFPQKYEFIENTSIPDDVRPIKPGAATVTGDTSAIEANVAQAQTDINALRNEDVASLSIDNVTKILTATKVGGGTITVNLSSVASSSSAAATSYDNAAALIAGNPSDVQAALDALDTAVDTAQADLATQAGQVAAAHAGLSDEDRAKAEQAIEDATDVFTKFAIAIGFDPRGLTVDEVRQRVGVAGTLIDNQVRIIDGLIVLLRAVDGGTKLPDSAIPELIQLRDRATAFKEAAKK